MRTANADAPPFSLIEYKGLLARLGEEIKRASGEFARDPKAFFRSLVVADSRDARRRRLLNWGLLVAGVVHAGLLVVVMVAGWHRFMAPVEPRTQDPGPLWVARSAERIPSEGTPITSEGSKLAKGFKDGGGGGGGQQNPEPVAKGLPRFLPQPQLVQIDSPAVERPAMPVPAAVTGPETAPPPVPLGTPSGKTDSNSGGPGTKGGMGTGEGPGVGSGKGPGSGPGSGGGTGYGIDRGEPGGDGSGPARVKWGGELPTGYVPFRWLFRPTPVTTPEAQLYKSAGDVLLRADFNANGTITNIDVVNPVEFMTESAIEAVRRSRFKPATVNGKPVTMLRVLITVKVHY